MAKKNFRIYLKGDLVRVKKYFYALRPVLACCWIEKYNTMPPTEFELLYNDAALVPELVRAIDQLLERKKAGDELDVEEKIEVINTFLDERIEHFSASARRTETSDKDIAQLDLLFKEMLQNVWGEK
jgi:predicted nucleotidyltransferase